MGFENKKLVLIRGAGDLASGIIWSLAYSGFKVVCTEISKPSCIRTEVSFSDAIYNGSKTLDGITCVYVENFDEISIILEDNKVALIVDKELKIINSIKFDIVVDAIMAKKNTGTSIGMADIVIGVGPGFTAGLDCHYVIETMRGHNLSKIYDKGSAIPNTGVPGLINGHSYDRVMHSPAEGIFHSKHKIGDIVRKGEILADIDECSDGKSIGNIVTLKASIEGLLRGIIHDGFYVTKGLKCADIDPRVDEHDNAFTISDKARSIGSAVLLAIMHDINYK